VGQDENRHAVVVVALPAAGQFVSAAACDDGAGGQQLGEHLAARSGVGAPVEPVEEAEPRRCHRRVHAVLRPGDVAVQGHGHAQPDARHRSAHRPRAIAQVQDPWPVQGAEQFELDVVGRQVVE
jgi:hypothetical protein